MDDRRSIDRIALERVARVRRQVRSVTEIRFWTKSVPAGKGEIKNVSPSGLFVLTGNVPVVGESVRLVFRDDLRKRIELLGVVRWKRPRGNEAGGSGFGLEIYVTEGYKTYVKRLLASVETAS